MLIWYVGSWRKMTNFRKYAHMIFPDDNVPSLRLVGVKLKKKMPEAALST